MTSMWNLLSCPENKHEIPSSNFPLLQQKKIPRHQALFLQGPLRPNIFIEVDGARPSQFFESATRRLLKEHMEKEYCVFRPEREHRNQLP